MDNFNMLYRALQSNASAMRDHNEMLKREIESKNRVDISLSEYEEMKQSIAELKKERNDFERKYKDIMNVITQSHFPVELMVEAVIEDIDWEVCMDPINMKRKYRLEFTVDEYYCKMAGV